jgi:hypothetical protein
MSDADCWDWAALVLDSHRLLVDWGCWRKRRAGAFMTATARGVDLMARCLQAAHKCATAPLALEIIEERMFGWYGY